MHDQAASAGSDVEDLHIRIFAARHVELPARSWNSANVQDPFWRLYINNRTGAALKLADGPYLLEPGRLYMVPAGVRFSCENTASIAPLPRLATLRSTVKR